MIEVADKPSGLSQTMVVVKEYVDNIKQLDWSDSCLRCDHQMPLLENNLCADCDNPLMAMENEHIAKGRRLLKLPSPESLWLFNRIKLKRNTQ